MDKPIIFVKKADKTKNRVILPKAFVERNGEYYYMEVYKEKIILKPIKNNGG